MIDEQDKPKISFTPPAWATEPGHTIPLGFDAATARAPDRFHLGVAPNRAMVLLDQSWRKAPAEDWVNVAAGAYQALCGTSCTREIAELIAKGWLAAAGIHAARVREAATRIILPQHYTQQ